MQEKLASSEECVKVCEAAEQDSKRQLHEKQAELAEAKADATQRHNR